MKEIEQEQRESEAVNGYHKTTKYGKIILK